jgi:hypothetical protein
MPSAALELSKLYAEGLNEYHSHGDEGRLIEEIFHVVTKFMTKEHLYVPDEALKLRIDQYIKWSKGQSVEDPGKLMEQIALLAFRCVRGWNSVRSFQSYAAQLDLVISGTSGYWRMFLEHLHLKHQFNTIVVECKNLADPVDDQQFKRLCYILQNDFHGTAALGIFLSRKGASGFPRPIIDPRGEITKPRSLKYAQATQILFHAKTDKYVVVLDEQDILRLGEPGALIGLLERKIRAVEQWPIVPSNDFPVQEIDLPAHLRQCMSR